MLDLTNIITPGMSMRVVEPNQYEKDWDFWNGRLLMWEAPEINELYAIGVDPSEGVGADRSVCEVIKVGNLQHPDIQVAEFACDFLDPVEFSAVVHAIGHLYKDSYGEEAFCTVEINAPCGQSALQVLQGKLGYSNLFIWKHYDRIRNQLTNQYGWWTNKTTRPMIIAHGLHALGYGDLIINSPYVIQEMQDFERETHMAKAGAKRGRHDDRLMALLICHFGAHDEEYLAGEDLAEERRALAANKDIQVTQAIVQSKPKPDYWSMPISFADAQARAEANLFINGDN